MSEGSVAGTLVRLVLSLTTVLTLMVFLARYLRHRQLGTGFGSGASPRRKRALPMEVVTRQGLSRGSSIAVVRVSGQLLLLGVTESSVSILRELEEPVSETADDVAAPAPGQPIDLVGTIVESLRRWTVRHG